MRSKKFVATIVVFVLIAAIGIGTTVAYFTNSANSMESVFTAGSLTVEINQDSVIQVSDVLPGAIHPLEFSVKNTGSLPVQLKGYLEGRWQDSSLSNQVLSVENLEIDDGNDKYLIDNLGDSIADEFMIYKENKSDLRVLAPNETIKLVANIKFSELMDNRYQGAKLDVILHLAAKQNSAGSEWPAEY